MYSNDTWLIMAAGIQKPMATPQMRQISSGKASCPLFLTNLGICAGTLTFASFIHQDNPPSPSLEELPQSREASSPFTKKIVFPPRFPLKTQFQIALCSSAHVSPANSTARERNVEPATHTHVCTQNTGKVASCWRRHFICLWLTATRVQWQS